MKATQENGLYRNVAIVGAGIINFGELFDKSFESMIEDAYLRALQSVEKGLDPSQIEAAWIGTLYPPQGNSGLLLAFATGLFEIPITRVENACATGSDAFRTACMAIAAGVYDLALVVGVEKMRDDGAGHIQRSAVPQLWGGRGVTMPAFFGLHATAYMHKYQTTREDLALVSVKNHHNGKLYPHAHYRFECSVQDVLNAPFISYPLGLYDCCPVTDGAAALIVCHADVAEKFTDKPVYLLGSGLATDTFFRGGDLASFPATQYAAQQAYAMAGVQPDEIDVAEIHDCFSITELISYEDLGFAKPGQGVHLLKEKRILLEGDKPINPSGGLLAKGHPIGATGVAQLVELFQQLRGEAGPVQVKNHPELALQHNIGIGRTATGSVACVHILGL
jgi:acetyl-CoA C-acetyltransferase